MVSNRRREEHEENGNRGQTSEESERLTASTMRRGPGCSEGAVVDEWEQRGARRRAEATRRAVALTTPGIRHPRSAVAHSEAASSN